jgi:hypothetical protein
VLEAAGTEESGCRRGFSGSRDKESRSRDGCSDSGAGDQAAETVQAEESVRRSRIEGSGGRDEGSDS